jgi:hypothetical protein
VNHWIVEVGREVTSDFIATVLVPEFDLPQAEQQREQNGDAAHGLTNVCRRLDVHAGPSVVR